MVFINKEKKALFLHIPKCGGSYVRNLLLEKYNFNDTLFDKHQNHMDFIDNRYNVDLLKIEDTTLYKHAINKMGKYRFFCSHQKLTEGFFNDYFKFTFVRNPYTKIVSAYLYVKKLLYKSIDHVEFNSCIRTIPENKEYYKDLNTFIQNYEKINIISYCHAFITQYDQLLDFSGNICFDYIGKQENLDSDLLNILTILNFKQIDHEDSLYFGKILNESKGDNLYEYYDEEIFLFVNKHFAKDFEVFNYKKFDTFEEFTNVYRHFEQVKDSIYTNHDTFIKIPNFIKAINNEEQPTIYEKSSNQYNGLIPKNIIQTYKTNFIHPKVYNNVMNILNINKDYDYYFVTDNDGIKMIEENFDKRTMDAFNKIKIGAAKGDFIRYIALYLYGGVYLDLDAGINIDLNTFIPKDKEFIFFYAGYVKQQYTLIQWIIIIKPFHEIIKNVIEEMVNRIHNDESKIYLATGPKLFTDVIFNMINNTNHYNIAKNISHNQRKELLIENGINKYINGLFFNISEYNNDFKFNFYGYKNTMLYSDESKYNWASNIFNIELSKNKRQLLGFNDFDTSILHKEIISLAYSDYLQKKNINKYSEIINFLMEELSSSTNNYFLKKEILNLKKDINNLNTVCDEIFDYNSNKLSYIRKNLIETFKNSLKENICEYCNFKCLNEQAYNSHMFSHD